MRRIRKTLLLGSATACAVGLLIACGTGYRTVLLRCTTYAEQVLTDSPLVYYKMDDTSVSGGIADSSGNGQTGTMGSGTLDLGQPGAFSGSGKSFHFNGAEYIRLNALAGVNKTAGQRVTIEVWVKWVPTVGDAHIPWGFQGTAGHSLADFVNAVTDNVGLASGFGELYGTQSTAGTRQNVWLYMVWDMFLRLETGSKMYINAELQSSFVMSAAEQNMEILTGNLELGRYYNFAGNFWKGYIDEFAVYNGALSLARIQAHYQTALGSLCTLR